MPAYVRHITMRNMRQDEPETPAQRFDRALTRSGVKNSTAFAKAHDLKQPTVHQHRVGKRPITLDAAETYAKILGVTPEWILYGVGGEPDFHPSSGTPTVGDPIKDDGEAGLVGFWRGLNHSQRQFLMKFLIFISEQGASLK